MPMIKRRKARGKRREAKVTDGTDIVAEVHDHTILPSILADELLAPAPRAIRYYY